MLPEIKRPSGVCAPGIPLGPHDGAVGGAAAQAIEQMPNTPNMTNPTRLLMEQLLTHTDIGRGHPATAL
jgi:hypothetical protein